MDILDVEFIVSQMLIKKIFHFIMLLKSMDIIILKELLLEYFLIRKKERKMLLN